MAEIILACGAVALLDDADLAQFSRWRWTRQVRGGYARRSTRNGTRSKTVYLHREIMSAGADDVVDHINGDTLDNRRANLRLTTAFGNQQNRRNADNEGVTWVPSRNRWCAKIGLNGRSHHLGFYAQRTEAEEVRKYVRGRLLRKIPADPGFDLLRLPVAIRRKIAGLASALALFFFIIGDQPALALADAAALNRRGTMEVYLPPALEPSQRTLAALAEAYRNDPYSRYQAGRFCTRQNMDALLSRLLADHGATLIASITPYHVLGWHRSWLGADPAKPKVAMAHALIGCLRTIIGYGNTMLQWPECRALKETLSGQRFSMSKPRTVSITAAQVVAVRARAHEAGLRSIALAQAIQFSCTFRQKDVVGEWVPNTEKVKPLFVDGDRFWLRGVHWSEIDENLILRHVTSKRQKPVEIDLKLAPMVMAELQHLAPLEACTGPVIISEETGVPYTAVQFRRLWRKIADAAAVPGNVRNMDTRSGAITEAFALGASGSMVRKAATHSQQSQTDAYNRGDADDIAKVMQLRAQQHSNMEAA